MTIESIRTQVYTNISCRRATS